MMIKKYLIILFLMCVQLLQALFLNNISAQEYNFRKFSLEDGLPQMQVNTLFQDKEGYLWIGTTGGVCRHDGRNYSVYDADAGLLGNNVRSIVKFNNNIYVGTDKGISIIENDTISIVHNIEIPINDLVVWNDKLIVASNNGLYQVRNDSLLEFNTYSKLDDWFIRCLYIDKKNELWVGTGENDIVKIVENEGEIKLKHLRQDAENGLKIRGIVEDANNNVWIGTAGKGIMVYNGDALHEVFLPEYLKGNFITSVNVDKSNNIWFGTWGEGVIKYDGNVFTSYNKSNGLLDEVVLDVFVDFEGNVWIATLSSGVLMFTGDMFYSYSVKSGLPDDNVRGLYSNENSEVYITTLKGIALFDGLEFDLINKNKGLSFERVGPVIENHKSEIVVGTYSGDIDFIKGKKVIDVIKTQNNDLFEITSLYEIEDDKYLVGTFSRGLYLYENSTLTKVEQEANIADNFTVWNITLDGSTVLIGTDIGVLKYDQNKLERFRSFDALPEKISVNDIKSSKEFLCVATKSMGLYIFKRDIGKWYHFTKNNALPINNILSIAILNERSVVVSSVLGIVQFEFDEDKFRYRKFDKDKGIGNAEFNQGISLVHEGEVWFGTGKGILVFDTEKEETEEVSPKVNIKDIELFYGREDVEQFKDSGIYNLILPYDENHLTFTFDGIHFRSNKNIKFQYKLESDDEEAEWGSITEDRHITFANINPGAYKFSVRCTVNNGKDFSKELIYSFKIKTPFWQQYWFYFLVIFVFLFIGVAYVYYTKRNELKLQQLIQEKTLKLRESEEKYRYIIETASDTIYQVDLKGNFTYVNEMAKDLTGYETNELLNLNYIQLIDKNYRDRITTYYQSQIKKGFDKTHIEFPINTKQNEQKWVGQTVKALLNNEGKYLGFQAIVRDITEKKNAEVQLKLLADRLKIVNLIDKTVLEANSHSEVIKNTITSLHALLGVKRVSITLFDYEKDVFLSYSTSHIVNSQLGDGKEFPLSHFGGLKNIESNQYHLVNDLNELKELSESDKKLIEEGINSYLLYPLMAYGELFGSLNVSTENTNFFNEDIIRTVEEVSNAVAVAIYQNKLSDKLKESEERFRELFEGTIDMIISLDADGNILFANKAFEDKVVGAIGKNIFNLMNEAHVENNKNTFERIIKNIGQSISIESTLVLDRNENVIISGNAIAKFKKGGDIQVTCIMHDITERKRNEEIIRQKNEDILDSIIYAQRIQKAILPTDRQFDIAVPNSFVFYEPKEIVSGDFYFVESVFDNGNEMSIVGLGDCTGHGVPGAFMSLYAHNFLKRSINEPSVTTPAAALNFIRSNLLKSFREGNLDDVIHDGMDIALLAIDYKNLIIHFSGAYRPVYIVRGGSIIEIKGDRQPVGYFENMKPFTNHEFKLKKGDTIYLFSDGITDQFSGDIKKKFSTASFKKLLVEISGQEIKEQEQIIKERWYGWMGSAEQTDDACLIGIRV